MNRSTIDLWVGIFVTIGIGAVIFLALKVGNLNSVSSSPGYRLQADFENIGGLQPTADGLIDRPGLFVDAIEQGRWLVIDELNRSNFDRAFGQLFTNDTIASILTSGLLGEVYVGLDAGGDTKMLADGGRIGKTQSAVVLEKLIGQFMFSKAAEGTK